MLYKAPKRAVERLFEKNSDFILPNKKSLKKPFYGHLRPFFLLSKKTKMSVLNNTNNNIS